MMERRSHSEKFNIRGTTMAIITFNEIIEVNGILEQKHLNFKLHLRDACGAQLCGSNHWETVPARDVMMRCIR